MAESNDRTGATAGTRLLTWMATAGHRASDAAEIFGVSTVTLASWTAGKSEPKLRAALAVEKLTNGAVRCSDWIGGG